MVDEEHPESASDLALDESRVSDVWRFRADEVKSQALSNERSCSLQRKDSRRRTARAEVSQICRETIEERNGAPERMRSQRKDRDTLHGFDGVVRHPVARIEGLESGFEPDGRDRRHLSRGEAYERCCFRVHDEQAGLGETRMSDGKEGSKGKNAQR